MRRLSCYATLVALATLALPASVTAQDAWLGVGGASPLGGYSDWTSTGFLLVGGLSVPVGSEGLSLFGEGFYGQNSGKSSAGWEGTKVNPIGIMGGVELDLAPDEGASGVYLFGEVGVLLSKYTDDTFPSDNETVSGLGYGGGAGFHFPLGGATGWVEGRAISGSAPWSDGDETTSFLGVLFGLAFPVGGN